MISPSTITLQQFLLHYKIPHLNRINCEAYAVKQQSKKEKNRLRRSGSHNMHIIQGEIDK